jgi:murein L,D-transpeptidase YcbB/YkuD
MTAIPAPTALRGRRPRPRRRLRATALLASVLVPGGAAAAGVAPALRAAEVQGHLVALGLLRPEAASGRYDRPTANAVARFQATAGLHVDGVAGAATADALLARAG